MDLSKGNVVEKRNAESRVHSHRKPFVLYIGRL